MYITRKSMFTGVTRTLELDVTPEQYEAWQSGTVIIQSAMPNLSADEREFIMTGVTSDEWDAAFSEEDPDRYCITTPDGDCISTDPRCMHQPKLVEDK